MILWILWYVDTFPQHIKIESFEICAILRLASVV